ncbi:sensor histidine kinase [Streptomyces gamaensis]|uniref:histidine kinase n=1 Tax=Streptomyces gamaensis TaxID=1763542 RepID=A0ABW0ZDY9_9ACTN
MTVVQSAGRSAVRLIGGLCARFRAWFATDLLRWPLALDITLAASLMAYSVWRMQNSAPFGAAGSTLVLLTDAALACRSAAPRSTLLFMVAAQYALLHLHVAPVMPLIALMLTYFTGVARFGLRWTGISSALVLGWLALLHLHDGGGVWQSFLLDFRESATIDVLVFALVCFFAWAFRIRRQEMHRESERAELIAIARQAQAAEALAVERARIAREVHDIVAHGMSTVSVQAAAATALLDSKPEQSRQSLDAIARISRESLEELRTVLGTLRHAKVVAGEEETWAPQARLAELPRLLDRFEQAGMDVEFTDERGELPCPPGVELAGYRVVQEALTNALKYSAAAGAHVSVRQRDDQLEIDVRTSSRNTGTSVAGTRSPSAVTSGGYGLIGLRERVSLYGGRLDARPDGDGFRVTAVIPLSPVR